MADRDLDDRLARLAEHAQQTGRLRPAADVRGRGERRRRHRYVTSAALGAVLVAGLGFGLLSLQTENRSSPAPPAATVSSAPTVPAPTSSAPTTRPPSSPPASSSAPKARAWAGTTQFMEISGGEIRGGIVYLKVRPAIKEPLGESFETKPGSGPFTEVAMADSSRTLTLDGESGSPEVFVDTLKERTKESVGEAFDVTFDSQGKVTTVEWLSVPGS